MVYSTAVAAYPPVHALAAPAAAGLSASEKNVLPVAGAFGQFDGRKTIPYVSGSFGSIQAEAVSTVYVLQDQEFHFVLAAAYWGLPSASGVDMSIRDAAGNSVFSMTAAAGTTQAQEGYLDAGVYTVVFVVRRGGSWRCAPLRPGGRHAAAGRHDARPRRGVVGLDLG